MALANIRYDQVPYEGYTAPGTPFTMPRARAEIVGEPPRRPTLEELMRMGEFQGWQAPSSEWEQAPPSILQTQPPAPAEEYYRGTYEGVPSYTNIPDVAAQKRLQRYDLAPPVAQVGGVEMYGTTEGYPGAPVTSKLQAAQMTGAFKPSTPITAAPSGVPTDPVGAWKQGRDIYMKVLSKGQELQKTPEEIKAELEYRGVGKIDPWSPPKELETKVPVILPSGQTVNVKPSEALKYSTSEENRKARQAQFNNTMEFKKQLSEKMIDLKSRLEPALLQDVIKKEDSVSQYANLIDSFDKNFAGKVAFGPTGTAILERTGGEPERVAWWKRFNTQDAALRHDLFGATMTDNEKAAWDRITINENTNADTAANELAVRHKIVVDNLARNLDKYEATGRDVSGLRQPPTAATGGGVTGGRVKVISPDGKIGNIPESQLSDAMAQGYKRSQ